MSISIESTVGIIATWLYLLTVLYKNWKNKKKPSKEKSLGIFRIEGFTDFNWSKEHPIFQLFEESQSR